MTTKPIVSLVSLLLITSASAGHADEPKAEPTPAPKPAMVERGSYLVNRVAMCIQCHSPRDERGDLVRHHLLEGGTIPLSGPFQYQTWAFRAPPLIGLPAGYTENDIVALLSQGKTRTGAAPRHPMPPFRMEEEDARAVAAYLSWVGQRGEVKDAAVSDVTQAGRAVAVLRSLENNRAFGVVAFAQQVEWMHITADFTRLDPGSYAVVIRESGDCGAAAMLPEFAALGRVVADANGRAHFESLDDQLGFFGDRSVSGRMVVLHAVQDGALGAPLACGIIEKM